MARESMRLGERAGGGLEIKDGGGIWAGPGAKSPVPPPADRSPEDQSLSPGAPDRPNGMIDEEILDAVAGRIVRMGLTTPAIFFLESSKPLSYVGSQGLVFLEPFIKSVLNLAYYDRFVRLMEDRANFERLIERIEELDELEQKKERDRKREAKEQKSANGSGGPTDALGAEGTAPKGWRRLFSRGTARRGAGK